MVSPPLLVDVHSLECKGATHTFCWSLRRFTHSMVRSSILLVFDGNGPLMPRPLLLVIPDHSMVRVLEATPHFIGFRKFPYLMVTVASSFVGHSSQSLTQRPPCHTQFCWSFRAFTHSTVRVASMPRSLRLVMSDVHSLNGSSRPYPLSHSFNGNCCIHATPWSFWTLNRNSCLHATPSLLDIQDILSLDGKPCHAPFCWSFQITRR